MFFNILFATNGDETPFPSVDETLDATFSSNAVIECKRNPTLFIIYWPFGLHVQNVN